MIAINFKLTPAQTKMLLNIAYSNYTEIAPDIVTVHPRQEGLPDMFITTIRCLINRKLVVYKFGEWPVYQITPEGQALASMIVSECRDIVTMVDTMPKRLKALAPAIKRCKEVEARHAAWRAKNLQTQKGT